MIWYDERQRVECRRSMKKVVLALLFLFSVALDRPLCAGALSFTLKPGDPERRVVLGALRSAVRRELKMPVVFRVDHLKVQDDWAFFRGVPRRPDGKPLSYQGTPYEEAIRQGMFDDWICALLRKEQGRWGVVIYVIGATDVPYEGWDQKYHAPPAIFR